MANIEKRFVGWTDSPILPESISTLKAMGEFFKDVAFDSFYLSPAGRCEASYKELGLANVKEKKVDDRLREVNCGDYEGLCPTELPKTERRNFVGLQYNVQFPGGESLEMVEARVKSFLEAESPKWDGKTIGIMAHWGPNQCISKVFANLDDKATISWRQPNNIVYKFENGKISWHPFGQCHWYEGQYVCRQ